MQPDEDLPEDSSKVILNQSVHRTPWQLPESAGCGGSQSSGCTTEPTRWGSACEVRLQTSRGHVGGVSAQWPPSLLTWVHSPISGVQCACHVAFLQQIA